MKDKIKFKVESFITPDKREAIIIYAFEEHYKEEEYFNSAFVLPDTTNGLVTQLNATLNTLMNAIHNESK